MNFVTADEDCPIDCVPNRMREARVGIALNNSFAFGGNNAATVFARWR
jgi:3-oxoacyl-[acyl-carrier-protein] synthase II